MTNAEKFVEIANTDYNDYYLRTHYAGRNFYSGPAIDVDDYHHKQSMINNLEAMGIACIFDNMGKGFVVHPQYPNAEYVLGKESDEDAEDLEDLDLEEVIEKYSTQEKIHNFENESGARRLLKLVNAMTGEGYDSVEYMLGDNPFMSQAIIQAMIDSRQQQEYKDNLIQEIATEDDDAN